MIRSYDDVKPDIADSAYVDETAVVIGDVTIESNASVWPGAVLRGDHGRIVLSEGVNVQDNATLHEDVHLERRVTVGHNAIVHGATVGRQSVIGMGAVVLDAAEIGAESIVAANSTVTEETTVPDSVLVAGTPAEPVKELQESRWTAAGDRYVELAKKHANTSTVLEPDD